MEFNSSSERRASENIFGMTFDVRNPFVDMPKKPFDDFNGFFQLVMTHILMTGLGLTIQQWLWSLIMHPCFLPPLFKTAISFNHLILILSLIHI